MKAPAHILTIAAIAGLGLAVPVQAQPHEQPQQQQSSHHHYRHRSDPGHGKCLRFNKTTGAIAGAAAGGVLGKVVLGGTGGLLVGAAAGGLAGHHFAHNGRKHCR